MPAGLANEPKVAAALTVLDLWIEERMDYEQIPGLALGLVYGDELVWSAGYGTSDLENETPMTPSTLFRVGSVTKLFTSVAVLQLRDAGRLGLDDPVDEHLPWFSVNSSFSDGPEITVRQLLTHTAGLPREAPFPYWTDHVFPSREELKAAVPTQDAIFEPSTRYKYSNLGMALLGEIAAEIKGEPYHEVVRRQIFEPLGMTRSTAAPTALHHQQMTTGYYRRKGNGERRVAEYYETHALAPAANIVSNVEDLARFAALMLNGSPVLKPSTVREMRRPHWVYDDWRGGRGLGFSVSRRDGKTLVAHGGWVAGHRCYFLLVPEDNIAVITMANADDVSPTAFGRAAYKMVAPAIAAATASPSADNVADPEWQRYIGTYTDPWDWQYRVLVLDDKLVMVESDYPPSTEEPNRPTVLIPVAEHTFRMSDGELVVFELDDDGKVQRIRRRYDYIYPLHLMQPGLKHDNDNP